jgi:hypothetical protein
MIRKALIAAAGSAATALVAGLGTALVDDGALTGAEVGISVGAGLLAAAAVGRTVWAVPNSEPEALRDSSWPW